MLKNVGGFEMRKTSLMPDLHEMMELSSEEREELFALLRLERLLLTIVVRPLQENPPWAY